jgi:hypothetical protein
MSINRYGIDRLIGHRCIFIAFIYILTFSYHTVFFSRPLLPTPVSRFSVEVVIPFDHIERHPTVGRTPLDEGSARRRGLYLTTTHNTHKRQTSMPPVGFFFINSWVFPFDPFCTVEVLFVLHVTLCFMLSSIHQTQHKHPCPRWNSNPQS